LRALEPIVLLLLAGIIRRWGSTAGEDPQPVHRSLFGRDRELNSSPLARATDREIIAYVEGLQLDYRARYNLACYYAGRGDDRSNGTSSTDDYRRAFSELAEALRTAPMDLVKWAEDDPSLAGLRKDEEFGPSFRGLVNELSSRRSKSDRHRNR
jgi:hypothetical protein